MLESSKKLGCRRQDVYVIMGLKIVETSCGASLQRTCAIYTLESMSETGKIVSEVFPARSISIGRPAKT